MCIRDRYSAVDMWLILYGDILTLGLSTSRFVNVLFIRQCTPFSLYTIFYTSSFIFYLYTPDILNFCKVVCLLVLSHNIYYFAVLAKPYLALLSKSYSVPFSFPYFRFKLGYLNYMNNVQNFKK